MVVWFLHAATLHSPVSTVGTCFGQHCDHYQVYYWYCPSAGTLLAYLYSTCLFLLTNYKWKLTVKCTFRHLVVDEFSTSRCYSRHWCSRIVVCLLRLLGVVLVVESWRLSIWILSSRLRLWSGLFSLYFLIRILYGMHFLPSTTQATCPGHLIVLG
jgi:hypothetical protein